MRHHHRIQEIERDNGRGGEIVHDPQLIRVLQDSGNEGQILGNRRQHGSRDGGPARADQTACQTKHREDVDRDEHGGAVAHDQIGDRYAAEAIEHRGNQIHAHVIAEWLSGNEGNLRGKCVRQLARQGGMKQYVGQRCKGQPSRFGQRQVPVIEREHVHWDPAHDQRQQQEKVCGLRSQELVANSHECGTTPCPAKPDQGGEDPPVEKRRNAEPGEHGVNETRANHPEHDAQRHVLDCRQMQAAPANDLSAREQKKKNGRDNKPWKGDPGRCRKDCEHPDETQSNRDDHRAGGDRPTYAVFVFDHVIRHRDG